MINFRFHLVSLVAVFLAMGLGILVGSTVIDQKIVNRLDTEIHRVSKDNDVRKAESKKLAKENADQQDFIDLAAPYVVDGRLDGQSVAIVAERGVDGAVVKKTETLLRSAGADVPAVLWLDDSWLLDTEQRVSDLQNAVGVQGDQRTIRDRALDLLAHRLATAPTKPTTTTTARSTPTSKPESSTTRRSTTTTTTPANPDVLSALDSAGFVSVTDGNASDFSDFPTRAGHVLVITGDNSHFAGTAMTSTIMHALVRAGVPSVVAAIYDEGSNTDNPPERGASLSSVLDDRVLSKSVSTIDDLDLEQGQIGVTLILEVVANGAIGHYGYGPDASAPLPPHPS
jgi:hypothetical protein